jgi:hypothetical protein
MRKVSSSKKNNSDLGHEYKTNHVLDTRKSQRKGNIWWTIGALPDIFQKAALENQLWGP